MVRSPTVVPDEGWAWITLAGKLSNGNQKKQRCFAFLKPSCLKRIEQISIQNRPCTSHGRTKYKYIPV